MNRYENHAEEWRDEDNQRRFEQRQSRKGWIDPRDPDFVAPDKEEESE